MYKITHNTSKQAYKYIVIKYQQQSLTNRLPDFLSRLVFFCHMACGLYKYLDAQQCITMMKHKYTDPDSDYNSKSKAKTVIHKPMF